MVHLNCIVNKRSVWLNIKNRYFSVACKKKFSFWKKFYLIFISSKYSIRGAKICFGRGLTVINSSEIQSEALEKLLKSGRLIRELIYRGECCVSRVRVLVVAAAGKRDSAEVRFLLSAGVKNALCHFYPQSINWAWAVRATFSLKKKWGLRARVRVIKR